MTIAEAGVRDQLGSLQTADRGWSQRATLNRVTRLARAKPGARELHPPSSTSGLLAETVPFPLFHANPWARLGRTTWAFSADESWPRRCNSLASGRYDAEYAV